MCMMSMVLHQGNIVWPAVKELPIPTQIDVWKAWQNMYDKAQKMDSLTGQPDCEDPEKLPILEKILKRLDELEAIIKKNP